MNATTSAPASWIQPFLDYWVNNAPAIAAAIGIILLGWLAGRLARGSSLHLANYINRLLDRTLRRGNLASARVPNGAITVIGEILFWAVFLFSIVVAARVAGIMIFAVWLDEVVTHFPHLVIGFAIIVLGWVIGAKIGSRVEGQLSGRAVQVFIVITALIIGFSQIGFDMTMPAILLSVSTGAALLGFSLAFGLGAKTFVSASIAGRVLSQQLQPGMTVRIGEFEGDIIEVTTTHLHLDTSEGHVLMPMSRSLAVPITIRQPGKESHDEQ